MRDRELAWTVGLVVLVVLLFGLFGGGMMGFGMWPGMMGGYYSQGYGPWWSVLMLLFWAFVIGGVALLISRVVRQDHHAPQDWREDSPVDMLRQRYARGEITREQYLEMRRELG